MVNNSLSGIQAVKDLSGLTLEVTPFTCDLTNKTAEIKLDLNYLLSLFELSNSEYVNNENFQLFELDSRGNLLDDKVMFQFDKNSDCKGILPDTVKLVFLLSGETSRDTARYYKLVYSKGKGSKTIPLISVNEERYIYPADQNVKEYVAEGFLIKTPAATYFYDKNGGGFARMIDREGKDWISFNNKAGSAGMSRGIPNAVHPEDVFHPGRNTVFSRILNQGPLKVTIFSESKDQKWSCLWEIYTSHAKMTMLKMDHPYWFLYEGTPFGKLDLNTGYFVLSNGQKIRLKEYTDKSSRWFETSSGPRWVYFGDSDTERVLFLMLHGSESLYNWYYTMEENMTVFGFGRRFIKKFIDTVPAGFSVGFVENADFCKVRKVIESVYGDCSVVTKV